MTIEVQEEIKKPVIILGYIYTPSVINTSKR